MFARYLAVVALALLGSAALSTDSSAQTPAPKPLDPVLSYSTYLRRPPGAQFGEAVGVFSAANAAGAVCVSFDDLSSTLLPPAVALLNPDGTLAYEVELPLSVSVIGAETSAPVQAITIDSTGNCYVALQLASPSGVNSQPTVAFVMKVSITGQVVYTYQVSGSGNVSPAAIAVDAAGEVYLAGSVQETDFPVVNAFQSAYGGGTSDGFLLKLNAAGSTLLFSTYFGGSASDGIASVAVDSSGNVVVAGGSASTNFPLLGTPLASFSGPQASFIAKFTPTGTLSYSSFLPSGGIMALDPTGAAYLLSTTGSIIKVNLTTPSIVYTFPGISMPGSGVTSTSIAVNSSGQAYVAGAISTDGGPVSTVAPIQSTFQGGSNDAFIFAVDPIGTTVVFSTFLGGPSNDSAGSTSVDSSANIYVSGITNGAFPLVGPLDGTYLPFPTCYKDNGGSNCETAYAFVSKISPTPANVLALPSTVNFQNLSVGSVSTSVGVLVADVGTSPISLGTVVISGDYALTNNCPATLAVAATCLLDVTFSPTAAGTRSGTIVISDSAGGPHAIDLTGIGSAGSVTVLPTTIDFGNQQVGLASPSELVNIVNSSQSFPAVTVNNWTTTGDFFLVGNGLVNSLSGTCSPLQPQSQCQVSVVFVPTATGVRTGTLTITDSDASSPQVVTLTGVGTPAGSGSSTVSPTSLSFASLPVGSTSAPQSVMVTNGTSSSVFFRILISGDFSESGCPVSLAPGASCPINVTFSPSAPGSRTGSMNIGLVPVQTGAPSAVLSVSLSGVASVASGASGPGPLGFAIQPGYSSTEGGPAGQSADFFLVIGGTGVGGTATLSCSGLPTGTTCQLYGTPPEPVFEPLPGNFTVSASTATKFVVAITTTAPTTTSQSKPNTLPWLWAVAFVGCFFALKKPRATLMACAMLTFLTAGCGGGSSGSSSPTMPPASTGTPAGTYTVTVTAMTGSTSQSLKLTLTVT